MDCLLVDEDPRVCSGRPPGGRLPATRQAVRDRWHRRAWRWPWADLGGSDRERGARGRNPTQARRLRCRASRNWKGTPHGLRLQSVSVTTQPSPPKASPSCSSKRILLDFTGDLYDARMRLAFIARIREQRRFASVDELVAEIGRDIARVRGDLHMTTDHLYETETMAELCARQGRIGEPFPSIARLPRTPPTRSREYAPRRAWRRSNRPGSHCAEPRFPLPTFRCRPSRECPCWWATIR